MSSCTIIYIEYKIPDKDSCNWHLLRSYIPSKDFALSSTSIFESKISVDGEKLCMSSHLFRKGIIRDLLNDQSKAIYGRGFPKQLSHELEEILEEEQSEIDVLNEKDPNMNHDWRYGKSWCYLSELRDIINNSYEKVLKNYLRERFDSELNKVLYKLDIIYKHLVPPPNDDCDEKDEVEEGDDFGYYYDELDDLIIAKAFCSEVESLVEFIAGSTWNSEIRLIYYTE